MQGYVQFSQLPLLCNPSNQPVEEEEDDKMVSTNTLNYIIISRRSRQRAGLRCHIESFSTNFLSYSYDFRYQRRGIDDEANVANFVETETILQTVVGVIYYLVLRR